MVFDKTVAIVIATYNGSLYIDKQVKSILNQSYSNFKLYISDDNSGDGTLDIIRAFNDERIVIHKNAANPGVVGNFNNALVSTSEDIILLSDQDDFWPSDRLEQMIGIYTKNHIEKHPFLMFTDMTLVDERGSILANSFYDSVGVDPQYNMDFRYLTWRCTAYGCTMLFNRELLTIALPIPDQNITTMHDNWLLLCAVAQGHVFYYNYKSVFYRQHQSNHTGGGSNSFIHKLKNFKKIINNINDTQKKRLSQINILIERGIIESKDLDKYSSIGRYLKDNIFPFKKEKFVYKISYIAILFFSRRFVSCVFFKR